MASLKALKYERALLEHCANLKELVLKNVPEKLQVKQDFLLEINNFFETAHGEGRRLRKALAFLHTANDSFKSQLIDHGLKPDENYGRPPETIGQERSV